MPTFSGIERLLLKRGGAISWWDKGYGDPDMLAVERALFPKEKHAVLSNVGHVTEEWIKSKLPSTLTLFVSGVSRTPLPRWVRMMPNIKTGAAADANCIYYTDEFVLSAQLAIYRRGKP
jgi:hypothetical protein